MSSQLYNFTFIHEEEILDAIHSIVSDHPKVLEVSQGSGNWYTNGETGPEWFTMDVICHDEDKELVQEFIKKELKKLNTYHDINFTSMFIYSHKIDQNKRSNPK